jgi:hypothetical protein
MRASGDFFAFNIYYIQTIFLHVNVLKSSHQSTYRYTNKPTAFMSCDTLIVQFIK